MSESPIPCPRPWRARALKQLAAAGDQKALAELVAAIESASGQPEAAWAGLLIAPGPGGPQAATWVQPLAGNTAQLWPPLNDARFAPALLRAAAGWAAAQGLSIVQAVIDTADETTGALLNENGFPALADLLYLSAPAAPHSRRASYDAGKEPVSFEAVGPLPSSRLIDLMKLIEDHSLDCPGLQGVLAPTQAIEGFRRQGQFVPEHWCVVRYGGQDAGALLLTMHPEIGCWELLYMGVVPRWRGHGLGERIIDEALLRTSTAGANLLLLSVDANNLPARRLYERAGFQVYAKRTLYAWAAETPSKAD